MMPPSLAPNMVQCLVDGIDSHFGIAGLGGHHVDWDEAEKRVAVILGVKKGRSLPKVSKQTLKKYHAYLRTNLEFPFKAEVEGLKGEATIYSLFDLDDCPELTFYGLFVSGRQDGRVIELPLVDIFEIDGKGQNKQILEDYCFWFWNHR
jgi:hypothetical protein